MSSCVTFTFSSLSINHVEMDRRKVCQPTVPVIPACFAATLRWLATSVTAGTLFYQGEPALFQEPLAGCGDLVVGSTAGAGLPLVHEPRVQQTFKRRYRGTLRKASRLLKLVRSRHPLSISARTNRSRSILRRLSRV